MRAFVNGKHVSTGNLKDMTFTFAQILERASYGVTLYPGEVIGSGTCGDGECFLELNGLQDHRQPVAAARETSSRSRSTGSAASRTASSRTRGPAIGDPASTGGSAVVAERTRRRARSPMWVESHSALAHAG